MEKRKPKMDSTTGLFENSRKIVAAVVAPKLSRFQLCKMHHETSILTLFPGYDAG
jgi:hypothetical protein